MHVWVGEQYKDVHMNHQSSMQLGLNVPNHSQPQTPDSKLQLFSLLLSPYPHSLFTMQFFILILAVLTHLTMTTATAIPNESVSQFQRREELATRNEDPTCSGCNGRCREQNKTSAGLCACLNMCSGAYSECPVSVRGC